VSSIADLPEQVRKEWTRNGGHQASSDKAFDQAVLYVGDDVDYAGLVAVVDAIHATTRELAVGGATERVPALTVSLAMAKDIGSGDPLVGGRLKPEIIQQVVRAKFDRYRACYQQGLTRNESLAGSVRIRFVIQSNGAVSEAGDAGESTLADVDAIKCIVHEFEKLSFPKPEGGIVTVVYPIVFNPGD
jgi:hypothetical protein